jgi:hypothetical protein
MQFLRKWARISGEAVSKMQFFLKTHSVELLPVGFKQRDSGLRLGQETGSGDAQAIARACHSAGGWERKGNVESKPSSSNTRNAVEPTSFMIISYFRCPNTLKVYTFFYSSGFLC